MAEELVTCTIEGRLCRLTLNRPDKLNALKLASFEEIGQHLDDLETDSIDCLLLSGAGRSFCAGHDLDDLAAGNEGGAIERLQNGIVERLATLPFPLVASVRGHCFTGGLELVLAADVIVAAETAAFADTHSRFDLVPIWGLTQRLPRRVGASKAKEMVFASRTYSGIQAASIGLVDQVVPEEQLDGFVTEFCADVLRNSSRSNRAVKKLMADTDGFGLAAGNAWELHHSPGHGPTFVRMIDERREACGPHVSRSTAVGGTGDD